jgi:hypothetical protein
MRALSSGPVQTHDVILSESAAADESKDLHFAMLDTSNELQALVPSPQSLVP